MKFSEIANWTQEELLAKLAEAQVQHGKLSFERQSKALKKSSDLGRIKRDIARMETRLTQLIKP